MSDCTNIPLLSYSLEDVSHEREAVAAISHSEKSLRSLFYYLFRLN